MSLSAAREGSAISGGNAQSAIAATLGISTGQNASTVVGQNCAILNRGMSNTFIGFNALLNSTAGNGDTVLGFGAAQNLLGNNNVLLGASVASNAIATSANVVVGAYGAPSLGSSGCSNVAIGTLVDLPCDASQATAVGHGTTATVWGTAIGALATANGRGSAAIGLSATTTGAGTFSLIGRVRGYYVNADLGYSSSLDTYAVQVEADALKLGNGAALAWCPKYPNNTVVASNCLPAWAASLSNDVDSGLLDLVFRSQGGAVVRFVDDFRPGLLDFTAQHRCVLRSSSCPAASNLKPGMVVSATGQYQSASSSSSSAIQAVGPGGGTPPLADEAVPVVEISSERCDRRAFGVLSDANFGVGGGIGGGSDISTYRFGNLAFDRALPELAEASSPPASPSASQASRWVVVNAAGEGGILVCDLGGPIRNGDLLTTAGPPYDGAAMRQTEPWVGAHTVAKATCDCGFEDGGSERLIGCVYKF
jgi:hypothetical protein